MEKYILIFIILSSIDHVLLETVIENLALEIKQLKNEVTRLKSDNRNLWNEMKTMNSKVSARSSFCDLPRHNTCGPCNCFDDYNMPEKFYCDCQNLTPKRDCLAFNEAGIKTNGLYKVTMNNIKTIQVYCDQHYKHYIQKEVNSELILKIGKGTKSMQNIARFKLEMK